ncbi:DUF3306 domain-containing protein [Shewanella sp. SNU WT4]|uniref:DUF3306 domain-containing protein n=1 Tax=Shewanella sp. SNU WT4 TaxID=2590015 RepID=UPI00112A32F4|nr:DUF3306 domain-containing protein [Shewanella sp. SNU WT4]QDF65434.1 DUF3306 domain-containing protein [Shewanella sp. SNU WT4]
MTSGNGLLSRWHLRRQQVAAEAKEDEAKALLEQQATEESSAQISDDLPADAEPTEAEAPQPLPDPEKIEVGGSFASFMGDNVDPLAKKAALRALWKQPHFNEIDGLLEYALDYSNQPKLSAEVSAELVNKVFKRVIEREQKELAEKEAQQAAQVAEHTSQINDHHVMDVVDSDSAQDEAAPDVMLNSHDDNVDNLPEPLVANDQKVATESIDETQPVTLG